MPLYFISPDTLLQVERVIGRMKDFAILHFLNHNMYKYIDQMLSVIAFITNMKKDIIKVD